MLTSLLNIIPPLHDPKSAHFSDTDITPPTLINTHPTTTESTNNVPPLRKLHIAILDCDIPVPAVFQKYGTYGQIFVQLLRDAAERVGGVELETSCWNAVEGVYPDEEVMGRVDCVLVGGSSNSAYDDLPWIKTLAKFIQDIYLHHPHTRLIGSCFGHQIICQSLFPLVSPSRPASSPIVVNNPRGWTVGLHPITIPDDADFSHLFTSSSSELTRKTLDLQFIHHDHVTLPVPAPFTNLGSTETCAVQGIYEKRRVFTTQGHAEFDREINRETLLAFGKAWEEGEVRKGVEMVGRGEVGLGKGDAGVVADGMLRFCLEGV